MALLNSPSSKSPIWIRDCVSSPSRSHFRPGLKLILRTQVTNPEIATFQSLSKGVYDMCIYMSVCSELIEETGRHPGLIFGMWRYFWPGSDKFEFFRYIRLVITGVYCIIQSPHIHCILTRESNSNITGYQMETV